MLVRQQLDTLRTEGTLGDWNVFKAFVRDDLLLKLGSDTIHRNRLVLQRPKDNRWAAFKGIDLAPCLGLAPT